MSETKTEEKIFNPLEEAQKEFNDENGVKPVDEPEEEDVNEHEDTELNESENESDEKSNEETETDETEDIDKTNSDYEADNDKESAADDESVSEDDRVVSDFDKYAEEIAEKENLSVEEAREVVRKEINISNNFKSKIELARAYRHLQQVKSELENKVKDNDNQFGGVSFVPEGHISFGGKLYKKEDVIEWYKEQDEDREGLSDDFCFKAGCKEIKQKVKVLSESKKQKTKDLAMAKRAEVLKSIPKEQQRFLPEIKLILGKVNDLALLSDGFKVDDVVTLAKGKMYDIDLANAKKSANTTKKRAESKSPSGSGSSANGKKKSSLSDEQKLDAAGRFSGVSQEEAEKLYIECGLNKIA